MTNNHYQNRKMQQQSQGFILLSSTIQYFI